MLQVFVTCDAFQFILDYLFDVLLYLIVVVLNSLLHAVVAIGILEIVNDRDRLIMAFLSLHFAIVFQQISCIFCIKMFAKLVYNTK